MMPEIRAKALPPAADLARFADPSERFRRAMATVLDRLKSPRSVRAYEQSWSDWAAWCAEQGVGPLEARGLHVQSFLTDRAATYSKATVTHRFQVLRQMYAALVVYEVCAENPCRELRAPDVDREPKTPWLEPDALARLLDAFPPATNFGNDEQWRCHRNRLVLLTFASMGLRRENVAGVAWSDVKPTQGGGRHLEVTVKGGKRARLAVPDTLWAELERWRVHCPAGDPCAIFPAYPRWRGHMNTQTTWRIVREAAQRAGLPPESVTPHALRRTFATMLAVAGEDGRQIQAAMAHAKWTTTERYIKAAPIPNEAIGERILAGLARKP